MYATFNVAKRTCIFFSQRLKLPPSKRSNFTMSVDICIKFLDLDRSKTSRSNCGGVSDDRLGTDCSGGVGISALMKCTCALHQLAYKIVPDTLGAIYPEWYVLVKSASQWGAHDTKRIRLIEVDEATSKDLERAFDVLKKKWPITKNSARPMELRKITIMMYTLIILHNMIRKDKMKTLSPDFYPDEQHREDNFVRTHKETLQVISDFSKRENSSKP
ncbi:ALP1-like protein [Tanacetum coccineum]